MTAPPKLGSKVLRSLMRIAILFALLLVIATLWIESMPDLPSTASEFRKQEVIDTNRVSTLRAHVHELCDHGPRHLAATEALRSSIEYIRATWESMGLTVLEHRYSLSPDHLSPDQGPVNLEVLLPGADRTKSCVVIGAHYDTLRITPGADDNASGVALLLELTRDLLNRSLSCDIRLVAFACEEPPYFWGEGMGSLAYARQLVAAKVPVRAMISLESLGYYRQEAGTQHYPYGFGAYFPDRGDFVAVVSNLSSRDLAVQVATSLTGTRTVPIESAALPAFIPGVGWSDHWSFWQVGVPAIMVTDTAPFRNPHYHRASDTPDTLDYERMAQLSALLPDMVESVTSADRYPSFGRAAIVAVLALASLLSLPALSRWRRAKTVTS